MAELLQAITDHREAILLGEIGALLHMFGKASSEFLVANSLEGGTQDSHQDLKHLPALKPHLENPILRDRFIFNLNAQQETLAGTFTDFITKYKGNAPNCVLLRLFNSCHRMTSADEKGVVRRTQSKDAMWIATPLGYKVQKVDLSVVDAVRETMDRDLAEAFAEYVPAKADIDSLHDRAIGILSVGMSQALGETRQPANDVTLWAQSHGVASLYKPVLASLALGSYPCPRKSNGELDYNNVRWRLFGVGWNGLGFVQRGRRPGDILRRKEILQDIRNKLQRLLEIKYPTGNLFYEDLNGIYFTFPAFYDQGPQAEALVRELAPELVEFVRDQSDMELWPFFTLSKPRRTLTAITAEIKSRDRLAALPRVAALLSLETEGSLREEKLLVDGPALIPPAGGQDICPVCQFWSKQQSDNTCRVCRDRRSRRQEAWQGARHDQTIWVDEVADDNNRIALLTLRLDLSRWFSGEWLTTLYSQCIDDWAASQEFSNLHKGQIPQRVKAFAKNHGLPYLDLTNFSLSLVFEFATLILKTANPAVRARLLQSFFVANDVTVDENLNSPYFVERHLENIAAKYESNRNSLTPAELVQNCFTQNPSPARLRRIWEATESFLNDVISSIAAETFAAKPRRLHFAVKSRLDWAEPRQTYRIVIPGLDPAPLTVLCLESGDHCRFLTVDSLRKFHLSNNDRKPHGLSDVRAALESGGISEFRDDEIGRRIPSAAGIPAHEIQEFDSKEYLPFIVLARSPAFCQLLLPAEKASHVLKRIVGLADERFGKVRGKLSALHNPVGSEPQISSVLTPRRRSDGP